MHETHGRCHCGNLETRFRSRAAPSEIPVRACQCSFCRKHGVRAVSDPGGTAEILVHDPGKLVRYQFGHRAADFLVCGRCGVYVAAVMEDGADVFATLIVNAFDNHQDFTRLDEPVSYAGEDEAGRRRRRREKWTPAALAIGTGETP
ncbi:MAG: hypothetical protein OXR84_09755 [Magnetovibrio sp.]|nr:hypothetical protein [Magnetovibrio sp.]